MNALLRRLEALEALAPAVNHDPITHFVIKPMEPENGPPWNPNHAECDDGEIWRRDDETPEQFEARAKVTFPMVGRMSRLISIGRQDARIAKAA
jgi:hypothetical protein